MNGEILSDPLFINGKFLMNCPSSKTECHHILHCLFFAWLDKYFSGGWIGRRGPIEWSPRCSYITPFDLFLCCWAHEESKSTRLAGTTNSRFFLFFLIDKRKVLYVCFRLQKCMQNPGALKS